MKQNQKFQNEFCSLLPAVLVCEGCHQKQKYYRQGGLNKRNLLFHIWGGCMSKIKVLASLVSPEAKLLGLQVAQLPSLYPSPGCSSVHVHPWYPCVPKFLPNLFFFK